MVAPLESVNVVRSGIWPSSGSALASSMAVATEFDAIPNPTEKGSSRPATSTPANRVPSTRRPRPLIARTDPEYRGPGVRQVIPSWEGRAERPGEGEPPPTAPFPTGRLGWRHMVIATLDW